MTLPVTTRQQLAFFEQLSDNIPRLISQYASLKAPHALMLSGPFGVGKATLAQLLAQTLLCESQDKPCGVCPGCVKVIANNHVNILEVKAQDRARTVKVEQARDLLDSLATYPFSAGPRVVILHLVDTFTPQAQNALLKAVEEPDPATFFILTCANEEGVLLTIRSRAQTFRLPPWEEDQIEKALTTSGMPAREAANLAPLAFGSPGRAQRIAKDNSFFTTKRLVDETILSFTHLSLLPAFSKRFKDTRDRADQILDYTLLSAGRLLKDPESPKNTAKAHALMEGVFKARRMQASNLSWQAIIDGLLIESLEEN